MRWSLLLSATSAPAVGVAGSPWPVVVFMAVLSIAALGWFRYLDHVERMKALDKGTESPVGDVMRAITGHVASSDVPATSNDENKSQPEEI